MVLHGERPGGRGQHPQAAAPGHGVGRAPLPAPRSTLWPCPCMWLQPWHPMWHHGGGMVCGHVAAVCCVGSQCTGVWCTAAGCYKERAGGGVPSGYSTWPWSRACPPPTSCAAPCGCVPALTALEAPISCSSVRTVRGRGSAARAWCMAVACRVVSVGSVHQL